MGAHSKDPKQKGKDKTKSLFDNVLDFGEPQPQQTGDPNQRIKRIVNKLKEISRRIDHLSHDM